MTPVKLQVECTLYHGCEVLTEGVLSDDAYFNNTVHFEQWITFGNLRVSHIISDENVVLLNPNEDEAVVQFEHAHQGGTDSHHWVRVNEPVR